MENSKKNLKIMSICILICTAITLVRLVLELVYAGVKGQFEASKGIVLASLIITFVIAFIILLPQIYVGLKGLKIAKNPNGKFNKPKFPTIINIILPMLKNVKGFLKKSFAFFCSLVLQNA